MASNSPLRFDGRKTAELIESQKKRYGTMVSQELLRIGQAYTGSLESNCPEKPSESLKRFKSFEGNASYGLYCWEGTSIRIDCKDKHFLGEDDFYLIEADSNGKLIDIALFFIDDEKQIRLFISDSIKLLPQKYQPQLSFLALLEDLPSICDEIIASLTKKP